jgi:hypothetical protein
MAKDCAAAFPLLDALVDGELAEDAAREVASHAAACPACAAELADRRRLKEALARVELPPPAFAPRRRRAKAGAAAAAAALVTVGAVLFLSPRPPEVVALSSELHDRYLEGRLTSRELGLTVSIPGADFVGRCDCPPALGNSVPLIGFRQGDAAITLLLLEGEPRLPDRERRSSPFPYWFFRAGRNHVLVTLKGGLTQVWVSRLPEPAFVRALQETQILAIQGDTRVTLQEMS